MDIIATCKPKLSNTSKMPCKSWSLQAIKTCPGSIDQVNGGLVEACQTCYAVGKFYAWPASVELREHNREDWKHPDFVPAMVAKMKRMAEFRWFDSGDCYCADLAEKIYQIMVLTPHVDHWLPTRSYKFRKIKRWLDKMNTLPNVVVRFSSDSTTGKRVRGKHTSTIIRLASQARGAHICPATVPGNTPECDAHDCRACWSKEVKTIAYHYHP